MFLEFNKLNREHTASYPVAIHVDHIITFNEDGRINATWIKHLQGDELRSTLVEESFHTVQRKINEALGYVEPTNDDDDDNIPF